MTTRPRAILIVDASVADRETIRRSLESDPDDVYTITVVERGEHALEQCRALPPACVVANYRLPDMDGPALLAGLATLGGPPIPVVFLADSANEASAAQTIRQFEGAHDYLLTGHSSPERVRLTVHKALVAAQLQGALDAQRRDLEVSAAHNASLAQEREQLLAREQEAQRLADESLALLDTLFESAPIGIAIIDRELRYVRVNRALADMNFTPAAAHLGRRASELFGALGESWERHWREVMASGEPQANREVRALVNGEWEYALVSYYPVRDREGAILGIGCVVTSLTERKHTEIGQRVLAVAGSVLAASPDTSHLGDVIRALFPELAAYGAIHLRDEQGQLQLVAVAHRDAALEPQLGALLSPAALASYGSAHPVTRALAEGQPIRDALVFPALDAEQTARLQPSTALSVPLAARGRFFGALTAAAVEPGRRYSAAELAVIEELARRCAIAIDAAQLYAEAQQAKAAAETAVELRDRFISIAAHELKTPLAVLLGNAQLLLRRAEQENTLDARSRRNLAIVVSQALRLNRLITALLDMSRLESGRLTIARVPLDLREIAQRLADELTPTLTRHVISVEMPEEPVLVAGDELRLEQVVQNLLHNAIKYSLQGGQVRVTVQRSDGEAVLSVSDQGIGIPSQDLPRLFERYFRASNVETRRITGMGYGLYVVREIVERHGGTITVASMEGQGSTFTVRLPLLQPPSRQP